MGVGGMLVMIPLASVMYTLLGEFTRKRVKERGIDPEKLKDHPPELKNKFKEKREKRREQRLLRKMKEEPTLREVPVIMATAKGTEYDKIQSLDLGADDYLVKPFGVLELVSRVKAVLRRCQKKAVSRIHKIGRMASACFCKGGFSENPKLWLRNMDAPKAAMKLF